MYAGAIYDAIYLYAIALNETLSAGGNKRDGRAIVNRMLNKEFDGEYLYSVVGRPTISKTSLPMKEDFSTLESIFLMYYLLKLLLATVSVRSS